MSEVFLSFVNTGISAGWLVLAVILLRWLFPKMPKWLRPVFWGLVGIRLVLFTSVKSVLSLIPSAQTIAPEIMHAQEPAIHSGLAMFNSMVNPVIGKTFAPRPGDSANPLQILIPVLAAVWIFGIALMAASAGISCLRLCRRLRTAVPLRENIYQSEKVSSPFVFGILRPRIYLPFGLEGKPMEHVILHERTHILRRDHRTKVLGYLLLSLYWFQPLCWAAYVLFCRDIELACDERVIRTFGREERADYSQALLNLSVPRPGVHACPLAFGETGVKTRVKNVLNYRKPVFLVVAVAVFVCIVMAVCFLTDPKQGTEGKSGAQDENGVICWYEAYHSPAPEGFWDGSWETQIDGFPGVTFRAGAFGVAAVTETKITPLISGMPVWNVYLSDISGDGLPELCATVSYGSGIVDEHIVVYDYARGEAYTLWERGEYDYILTMGDGKLLVRRRRYMDPENPEGDVAGSLRIVTGEDGERRLELAELGDGE